MNPTFSLFHSQTQSFPLLPNYHFCSLHVYRWLHSASPLFILIWLLGLFPIKVFRVLFGPPLPHCPWGGQWERQEGADAWGKFSDVFKLKRQWWKCAFPAFSIFNTPFKRRASFVLPSKLSHVFFLSRKCCSLHFLVLQEPVQYQRCLPTSLCVIISRRMPKLQMFP